MRLRLIPNIVIVVMLFLTVTGSLILGRGRMYPFVKFPMYGYAKTPPDELIRERIVVTLQRRSGRPEVAPDAFDFGLGRDEFSRRFIRPLSRGEVEAATLFFDFLDRTPTDDPVDAVVLEVVLWDFNHVPPVRLEETFLRYERAEPLLGTDD